MTQHHKFNVTVADVEIEVTTHHAWDIPPGEVYLQLAENGYEVQVGLSPAQARRLGHELLAAACVAQTKPEASLTVMGEPL